MTNAQKWGIYSSFIAFLSTCPMSLLRFVNSRKRVGQLHRPLMQLGQGEKRPQIPQTPMVEKKCHFSRCNYVPYNDLYV